jgi:hypothetical protein
MSTRMLPCSGLRQGHRHRMHAALRGRGRILREKRRQAGRTGALRVVMTRTASTAKVTRAMRVNNHVCASSTKPIYLHYHGDRTMRVRLLLDMRVHLLLDMRVHLFTCNRRTRAVLAPCVLSKCIISSKKKRLFFFPRLSANYAVFSRHVHVWLSQRHVHVWLSQRHVHVWLSQRHR